MKKSLRLLSALFSFIILSTGAYASHVAGGNITSQCIGPNEYLIRACFYRDASGITMPTTITVEANSSCGSVNVTIPLLPGSGQQVPNNQCATFGHIYEEYCYVGTLTLPAQCADWIISWSTCCRNDAISNLVNASSQSSFIYTLINNLDAPCNSSPQFNNDPIQAFCVGQEYYFDWGITEPDGDSLVFSFTAPNGTGTNDPLSFIPPATPQCPFPVTPPCDITIHPNSGIIHFTPAQQGQFVFTVKIEEYDDFGNLISVVIRDIQIDVVASCPPKIVDPETPISLTCGDTQLTWSVDTIGASTVKFQCGSVALDASDFRLVGPTSNPALVPIVSASPLNCIGGASKDILLTLFQPLKNGTYHLYTKIGTDGNTITSECGFALPEFDTVLVIVNDPSQLELTTETVACNATSVTLSYPEGFDCSTLTNDATDFLLQDANGTSLPVTSITSSDCNNFNEYGYQLEVTFGGSLSGASVYYLIAQTGTDNNTIANRCGNFSDVGDTLAIINVSGDIPVELGPNFSLCDYDPLPLLDPGVTAANYTWTLNGNTVGTDSTYQVASQGTYYLLISESPTCQGQDSVSIFITPSPQVDLGPDLVYCTGDPIQDLNATTSLPNPTYVWTLDGSFLSNQPIISPTQSGIYAVQIDVGAQCYGYDTISIQILQSITVSIAGIDTLCTGESATLTANSQPINPDTYLWMLNGDTIGGNFSTLQINEGGSYSVIVTTSNGCTGTQNFPVVAQTYPPATTAACASFTGGQYTYEWVPVAGAAYYQVSLDGGLTWITPSSGSLGTSHQTSVPTSNFVVQVFNGTKCSPGPASDAAACEIEIPNIITTNDDGRNDVFQIKNLIQYPNNNLKIFNRWGTLVFDKSGYGTDDRWWHGGEDLSGGVYFYVLNLNDGTEPRKGTITVVK